MEGPNYRTTSLTFAKVLEGKYKPDYRKSALGDFEGFLDSLQLAFPLLQIAVPELPDAKAE